MFLKGLSTVITVKSINFLTAMKEQIIEDLKDSGVASFAIYLFSPVVSLRFSKGQIPSTINMENIC